MRVLMWFRSGLFVAILACPLVLMLRPGPAMTNEKRTLAAMPPLSDFDGKYPERFDAYFRDQFGGRALLIRWYNGLMARVFRQSPVERVIFGRRGWLFYSNPRDGIDIRNFAGRWPHTPADIEAWLSRQDARAQEYAAIGARYLIAIAPDKQSIYPEDVPYRFGPPAPGVLDDVLARLGAHPRLRVLDLRPVLRSRKDDSLYYKEDSHWTFRGAFFAASAIADALRPEMPGVGTIREADYEPREMPATRGDLVTMLALDTGPPEPQVRLARRTGGAQPTRNLAGDTTWEQPGTGMPRAVLIGDSFGVGLEWSLCDAFSRMRYYMSTINPPYPDLVREEHPDVVILILVERNLPKLLDQ